MIENPVLALGNLIDVAVFALHINRVVRIQDWSIDAPFEAIGLSDGSSLSA